MDAHIVHNAALEAIKYGLGFPDGSVVKNLPASVGGTWFDPWSGRISYALEQLNNYWACALDPGSHNYKTTCHDYWSLSALEPMLPNKKNYCNENPAHRN